MDNFSVESFTPISYSFSDSSQYFIFRTTVKMGALYWDEISKDVDKWYLELCTYWDRPGIEPIFNPDIKTEIYLLDPELFMEQSETELPAWKCGFSPNTRTIITKLPTGNNSLYKNSYSNLIKNTLGQFMLNKHFNGSCEDYFSEGFGLFYTEYQPNRDSVLVALNKIGHEPKIEQLKNISQLGTTYQKDLITSYVEAQVLSVTGVQRMKAGGYLDQWHSHLEYYYNKPDNQRIKLLQRTAKFSIYAADSDSPH